MALETYAENSLPELWKISALSCWPLMMNPKYKNSQYIKKYLQKII